ncbi:MAG: ABC transporter ATP-binding protein [Deferribacteres bacterium]|nr:ABC transporter ATP-binding protein [candidate division KSB1 bacterium]MCB9501516.1 ABC transporter ATP-binding protein [Deferribacteres bacterium]
MQIELKNIVVLPDGLSGKSEKPRLSISCSFQTTDKIGIVGLSGSGKTTLLQLLAGMLEPDSGDILLDSENILPNKGLFKHYQNLFAMCFQFPEMQLFETTVGGDVAFGLKNQKLTRIENDKRVEKILQEVGFANPDFRNKPTRSLSQGEKRRVALAGILVMEKPVLLLDEPTAGLDIFSRNLIMNTLRDYSQKKEKGMVIISHDLQFLLQSVDKLWLMEEGRLAHSMECSQTDFSVLKRYIELPRAFYLNQRLIQLGYESALV